MVFQLIASLFQRERARFAAVIDVREPHELADGYVAGAVNVPLAQLLAGGADALAALAHLKDAPIVVYCRAGRRSAAAARALEERGFRGVHDLLGGFTAYSAVDGAEIVRPGAAPRAAASSHGPAHALDARA